MKGGSPLGRHVRPRLSGITCHVHEPIVGAGPDDAPVDGRWREREDDRVGLDAGLIERDGTARRAERRRIVPRQVGADALPALSFVGGLSTRAARSRKASWDPLARSRSGYVHWNRSVMSAGREAHWIVGPDIDGAALPGSSIDSGQQAAVASGVKHVDIARVRCDVAALAAADRRTAHHPPRWARTRCELSCCAPHT